MVKSIGKLLAVLLIAGIGYLAYLWNTQPSMIAPVTYEISTDYGSDVDMAEAANVLIIGDRLGKSLERYSDALVKKLSVKLKDPLRVFNWAAPNEGLNRTLHKLKSLKKFANIILYLGSSEEFYEERFHVKDYKKIIKNVEKFREENIATLLYSFPPASKLIYAPVDFFKLTKEIKKHPGDFSSQKQQRTMEIHFNLFDVELEEMIALVKENGSYLVLSTAPINVELPPKATCGNSTTESLESYQRVLQKKIDKGMHKLLLKEVRKLSETTIGNAKTYHLLGQTALGAGYIDEARKAFNKSAAYDCGNWRAHPVFNALIKKKIRGQGLKLIDFDNIVNRHLGNNELFLGNHFPQEIFYGHYIDEVYDTIKTKLNL